MSFELNQYYKTPPLSKNQYNNENADLDHFTLLGGQDITPQGDDDIDSLNQNQNIFLENSITENFIDNEYSAAPAPLRPHNFFDNNFNSESNLENYKIKKLLEEEEKNDIIHNKFSFFENPNFFENKKNLENSDYTYNQEYQEFEEENNINNDNNNFNIINDDENEKPKIINYKEISNSKNFIDSNFNMNSKDAPVNGLGNSSSSQDTNGTSNNNIDITPGFCNNNDPKENILDAAITNLEESNNNNENKIFSFTKKENETENNKKITKKCNQEICKKNKSKSNRRLKSDSIRKKIKARFHKKLRNIINKKLKDNGSKMYFELFPQSFITNIKISHNKTILKLTMKELLKMFFGNIAKDREKVKTNKKVLDYLDKKENINIKNCIYNFLNSSYADVIQTYMRSKYFEDDVNKLYIEGESNEYINKYKLLGLNWVEFYMTQKI